MSNEALLFASFILLVLPTFGLLTSIALTAAVRRGKSVALYERAAAAMLLFMASSTVALTAANRAFGWGWTDGLVVFLLALALIAMNIPNIVWFILFLTDKFDARHH
jgi:hypothetical protein